jgi:hypothetical protein
VARNTEGKALPRALRTLEGRWRQRCLDLGVRPTPYPDGATSRHTDGCVQRKAATGAVGIECEHGFDCCPRCDPCTCAAMQSATDGGGREG